MNILQSIVLGTIQGISEFFPISSSGHLVVFPYFFGWDYIPLYFTVTVHFATLLAVISVFYRDIYRIIKAVVLGIFIKGKRNSSEFKQGIFMIIGSIPAAVAGFFLENYVESLFSRPLVVAIFLMWTAMVLWAGEAVGRRAELAKEGRRGHPGSDSKTGFSYMAAFIVGVGQAMAIFPGISRAGSTISFARFFGIKRTEAVRFSFLLAVPVILGSFAFEFYNSYDIIFSGTPGQAWNLIAGFIFAYLAGFGAIRFLVRLARSRNLHNFAIYCTCLAAAVFIFYIIEKFI